MTTDLGNHSNSLLTVLDEREMRLALAEQEGEATLFSTCLLMGDDALNDVFFDDVAEHSPLFSHTPYAQAMQASPYCRRMTTEDEFFAYLMRRRPNGLGWCAWATADWQAVIDHWQSLLTVTMPDGKPGHFRFYSSGVMSEFLYGCTEAETVLLLGPMGGMLIPLPDEKWLCVNQPEDKIKSFSELLEARHRKCPWWKVTTRQIEALQNRIDSAIVHNIRLDAWMNHPEWCEPYASFTELDEFIARKLLEARQLRFTNPEEQTQFARLCLAGHMESIESNMACKTIFSAPGSSNAYKLARMAEILGVRA